MLRNKEKFIERIKNRILILEKNITGYSPPLTDDDISCLKRDIDTLITNKKNLNLLQRSKNNE